MMRQRHFLMAAAAHHRGAGLQTCANIKDCRAEAPGAAHPRQRCGFLSRGKAVRLAVQLGLVLVLAGSASYAVAATRYWDASNDPGLQAGDGIWIAAGGASNVWWSTSTAGSNPRVNFSGGDDAIFQTGGAQIVNRSSAGDLAVRTITQAGLGTQTTVIGNPLRFNNSTKEITNNSDLPLTFNNELRLFTPSATTQLLVDGTGDIVVGGVIFSQSNQGIRKQGSGMLLLSGDNTYLGVTNVDEGVLRISHASALGGLGNGTTIGTTANGHEFNTGVLELSGGVSFGAEPLTLIARNPAGGLAVQELAHLRNASGDNTWNGSIAFNTGGNRYNFESQAGLLTIAGAMNDGNGGGNPFLQLMGAGDGLITADFQFSNRTPRLIKKGTGTWTLDADGVNISQLHVEEGTFALGPAGLLTSSNFFNVHGGAFFDISAVSGPGFTLLSGQELRGDGTVIGDVLTNAGSNVSPGSSIGTLTFEDGLHLDGSLTIELDTGTLADLIDVAGLLDISDAMLVFDELNPIVPGDGPFVFAQYGTLEGVEFASVLGQPDGYEIDYNFNNLNQIALVAPQLQAVPEPAALALWLLAALVAAALAWRTRTAQKRGELP